MLNQGTRIAPSAAIGIAPKGRNESAREIARPRGWRSRETWFSCTGDVAFIARPLLGGQGFL